MNRKLIKSMSTIGLTFFTLTLSGCISSSNPDERMKQLGVKITDRGDGVVDLDLSGSNYADHDFVYLDFFCNDNKRWNSVHTLDLSDTSTTNQLLERLQKRNSQSRPRMLILKGTSVTAEAVKQFRAACPDCEVQYE